jgi:hypothetical protein
MIRSVTLGNVTLVPVALEDAAFIVELRAEPVRKGFLKKGADTPEMQRAWLEKYFNRSNREHEHYFIVTDNGRKCGTLRVGWLEPELDAFTWGSWCLIPGANHYVAVASYLLANEIGFANPRKKYAIFEVHHENVSVLAFHRRMGALETGSKQAEQIEFRLTRDAFAISKARWIRILESK